MPRIRATKATIDYSNDTPKKIMDNESTQQMRREYTALRDIMQKRFKRIEEYSRRTGEDMTQAEFYTKWHNAYYNGVPKLKDVPENRIPYILASMKESIQNMDSTIADIKNSVKARIEGLHDAGFTWINKTNLKDFGRFMEQYRDKKLGNVLGSAVAADLYGTYRDKGFSISEILQNWKLFEAEQEEAEELTKQQITTKLSSTGYKLNRRTKKWQRI